MPASAVTLTTRPGSQPVESSEALYSSKVRNVSDMYGITRTTAAVLPFKIMIMTRWGRKNNCWIGFRRRNGYLVLENTLFLKKLTNDEI